MDGIMRTCKQCQIEKPLSDFSASLHRNKKTINHRWKCKKCMCEYMREKYKNNIEEYRKKMREKHDADKAKIYYAKNRERLLEKHLSYRLTVRGRAVGMYNSAKGRARISKIPFTITRDFLIEKLENGKCERTGIAFDMSKAIGRQRNKFSPSVDKIDRNKGYTPENTQMVVWCYNTGKGEMTDDEFIEFCKFVVKNHEQ